MPARADRTYFNSHQMSAMVGGEGLQVNSLQSWSPDVRTRMGGDGVSVQWGPMSRGVGGLYSASPGQDDWLTDTTENITFLQLHFRAIIICVFISVKV